MTPERLTQIRQRQVALRACPYVVCPEPCSAPQCYGTLQYPLCRRPSPADEEVQQLLDALAARDADVQHLLDTCVPEEELAAVTADRNEVERLFKESEHVREDLDAKWEAAQARADHLEAELKRSQADEEMTNQRADRLDIRVGELEEDVRRRSTLYNELSEEKDCLEQQLAEAQSDVKHWEHSSEYAGTLLKQAEAQLTTLKDKLKEWDVVGLLNIYACSATANKLAALLATLETGSESK